MCPPIHSNFTDDDNCWAVVEKIAETYDAGGPWATMPRLVEIAKKNPRNAYVHYYIGRCLLDIGKFDAASNHFRTALKLAPTYYAARLRASEACRLAEEFDEAIKHADIALQQCPNDCDARLALGLAYRACGKHNESVRHIRAALDGSPCIETLVIAQSLLKKLVDHSDEPDEHYANDSGFSCIDDSGSEPCSP